MWDWGGCWRSIKGYKAILTIEGMTSMERSLLSVYSDERRCYFLPAPVLLFLLGIMSHRACVEVDDAQS
jgi:hypothetical protein